MRTRGPYVVYAIDGSSRPTAGVTASRLEAILRGLRNRKVRAELIRLAEEHLEFCDGTQEPEREPDIAKLLERLEEADGIIFGTPTYWFNMSARMKNLLERLTVTENDDDYTLEGIVAGFVATGDDKEDGAMVALSTLAATVNHLGMITFPYSMIYFRGQKGPAWAEDDIKKYPKRMITMMRLARRQRKEGW
jgi:multimeric flavodoxin WrbA